MRIEIPLAREFGTHLADGTLALAYREATIEPKLLTAKIVVLDFTDVRHANSSFVNALVAGLLRKHGESVLERLVFKGCNPVVRVLVEGAISLGLEQHLEHVA